MSSSTQRLRAIHPLLADSHMRGIRIRLVLRDADKASRSIEGIVAEISIGKDGRGRVRITVPTGSGDPVEVRVLLETIERIEPVSADDGFGRGSLVPGYRPSRMSNVPAEPDVRDGDRVGTKR